MDKKIHPDSWKSKYIWVFTLTENDIKIIVKLREKNISVNRLLDFEKIDSFNTDGLFPQSLLSSEKLVELKVSG